MMIAAIFDLDDTLLTATSSHLLFSYLHSTGQFSRFFRRRDALAMIAAVARVRLGLADATQMLQRSAGMAAGLNVEEVWQLVRVWFEEMLVHKISTPAGERLSWHRSQGHVPVICSAASQFSVEPVARYLGIEHVIYTEWLAADGRLTGKMRLPIAYGAGKVHWVKRWADTHGIDLAASYFYTDHISDRPLLELVGHPVAVNPERRLARMAADRGWTIMRWR